MRLQGSTATNGKAEMMTPMTSTDPLVEVLATRLSLIDLVGWQKIAAWAEQSGLSFEDLRLLLALALALKTDAGAVAVSKLAGLAGFALDAARREGIRAYVDQLDPEERERLSKALATAR